MRLVSFLPLAPLPTWSPSAAATGLLRTVVLAAAIAGALLVVPPDLASGIGAAGIARAADGEADAAPGDGPERAVPEGGAATADDLAEALATAESPEAAARLRGELERRRARSGSAAADLLAARAGLARAGGDVGTALDLLDAAVAIAPEWAMGRRLRGLVHLDRGAFGPATADFAEAIRRDPDDVPALLAAAALHEMRGEKARALELLRRAAALDPRAPGLDAAIERLSLDVEGRPT
jgi:tetratricopeptide (TPR) repeat protein